ncbi:MAG TPA: ABC transporter permease [Xanthobacteraceae bacterium]|nr:ABC transporter permease [Xanthobacteraceae bacterium]
MSVITAEKPQGLQSRRRRPDKRKRSLFNTTIGRAFLQALAVAALLVLWQAGVRFGVISDFLFGAPAGIYATFMRMAGSGELLSDTGYTLFEAILGFVIGTFFGSIAGLALWYSIFVARLVEPFIVAINSVPKIALAPIIILWFGTGLVSKVALAVSLTALVALIAAYQAAKDADTDLQALLISMGANKHQIFYKAVVPSTIPSIIATFRINIGFGLVGAVVGEFISSQHGLGHLIYNASSFYDLNTVWVGLFALMLVGFALYYVIDLIERMLIPWKVVTVTHQVQV